MNGACRCRANQQACSNDALCESDNACTVTTTTAAPRECTKLVAGSDEQSSAMPTNCQCEDFWNYFNVELYKDCQKWSNGSPRQCLGNPYYKVESCSNSGWDASLGTRFGDIPEDPHTVTALREYAYNKLPFEVARCSDYYKCPVVYKDIFDLSTGKLNEVTGGAWSDGQPSKWVPEVTQQTLEASVTTWDIAGTDFKKCPNIKNAIAVHKANVGDDAAKNPCDDYTEIYKKDPPGGYTPGVTKSVLIKSDGADTNGDGKSNGNDGTGGGGTAGFAKECIEGSENGALSKETFDKACCQSCENTELKSCAEVQSIIVKGGCYEECFAAMTNDYKAAWLRQHTGDDNKPLCTREEATAASKAAEDSRGDIGAANTAAVGLSTTAVLAVVSAVTFLN
jgi:hypothetical protein